MASRRSSRRSRPPTWTADYDVDHRDDLTEDEWPVKTLLQKQEEDDPHTGQKRRQYLVEWEEAYESSWIDEEDISADLKRRFHEGGRKAEKDLKKDVRAVMRDIVRQVVEVVDHGGDEVKPKFNVVNLKADCSPGSSLDPSVLSEKVKFELVWLFTMFLNSLSMSTRSGEGLEYRASFSIPCSEETLLSCFILPFTSSVSQVVNNLTYKFSLSIQQVDWILNHISVEQGCPWYQRDTFCSDACKIYGDISFTWCRVIPHYFSHANCNRCNASYEQAVHSGDSGGLDTCNPEVKPLSLPHHLKVSFNKKACKSTSWKD